MLSLCLTNYNRYEMLLESFQHVYSNDMINEIVINDDCSKLDIFDKIKEYTADKYKIRLFRNETNVGMSLNKKLSVEKATNKWCILFDSDNVLKDDYLRAIGKYKYRTALNERTIYIPDFASPDFDYRKFSGQRIDKDNIRQFLKQPMFDCLLNTANYIVNRDEYVKVYRLDPKVKASDTIHFNYLWLKSGGSFYVVPGMQYFHRVHTGSGFLADTEYNLRQAEKTKQLIMQL